jgi:hypothetical protein
LLAFDRFMRRFFLKHRYPPLQSLEERQMKESEKYRENAANCALLAQQAKHGPAKIRYKRMESAWLSLADEQDWLDGRVPPASIPVFDAEIRKAPPK